MEAGPFRPPLVLERPKKPSINKVKVTCRDDTIRGRFFQFNNFKTTFLASSMETILKLKLSSHRISL